MEEPRVTGRLEPRTEAANFEDLRILAQSNGALHELSILIFRDQVVTVDRHEARVVDDPEHRWSTSKLNKHELLLLLGLMGIRPESRGRVPSEAKAGPFDHRAGLQSVIRAVPEGASTHCTRTW